MMASIRKQFSELEMQDKLGWIWLGMFIFLCLAVAGGILIPKFMAEEKKPLEALDEPSSMRQPAGFGIGRLS